MLTEEFRAKVLCLPAVQEHGTDLIVIGAA